MVIVKNGRGRATFIKLSADPGQRWGRFWVQGGKVQKGIVLSFKPLENYPTKDDVKVYRA